MNSPKAVIISDIHFNLATLSVASAALTQAVNKANKLDVPLIIAGDIHDTKANIRGECINAIIDIIKRCGTSCWIIRGNHDSLNEKSQDHSLRFLEGMVEIVSTGPRYFRKQNIWLLPYYHDVEALRSDLSGIRSMINNGHPPTLIMHQGLNGSESGEYIQDKSALNYEDVKDFRVISGHYHRRQNIFTGPIGTGYAGMFSYVGNPFTLGFGEANDPKKGFQILMDDGSLEFVHTNLRRHGILDRHFDEMIDLDYHFFKPEDIVWIKITGAKEQLMHITKQYVSEQSGIKDFRLDLIPEDTLSQSVPITSNMSQYDVLDSIIDSITNTSDEQKVRLKELWRKSAGKI